MNVRQDLVGTYIKYCRFPARAQFNLRFVEVSSGAVKKRCFFAISFRLMIDSKSLEAKTAIWCQTIETRKL